MAGIKDMSPLFLVFDRPTYRKLIPNHLTEVLTMPPGVLKHLQDGAFASSITDRALHCEAIDEAHEMKINREAKSLVVRPTEHNMHTISNSLPFRAKMMAAFDLEIFPEKRHATSLDIISGQPSTTLKRVGENIAAMDGAIADSKMIAFTTVNRGLMNFFSKEKATPEQSHDLSFRKTGVQHLESYINTNILHNPTANADQRLHRLSTFSTSVKEKQRAKQVQREEMLIQLCMRKQIAMASENPNIKGKVHTFSKMPLALVDKEGMPSKGKKSSTTSALSKWYSHVPLVTDHLPCGWQPHAVVIEGMFIIYTVPPLHHKTMKEYTMFVLKRFVIKHFLRGCIEVHVIFDDPNRYDLSPKTVERERRDKQTTSDLNHIHSKFEDSLPPSSKWTTVLKCRECKHNLTT